MKVVPEEAPPRRVVTITSTSAESAKRRLALHPAMDGHNGPTTAARPRLGSIDQMGRLDRLDRFDLVIFDCDGVLIDSERLAVRTEAAILSTLGWPLTEADIVERFVGRSAAYMRGAIAQQLGRSVNWEAEFESRYRDVFERELVPVPGVIDALEQLEQTGTLMCVASSGSHDKMGFTLGLTGLLDRFEGRIFSADEVENGKPAHDVFLHAAEKMGVPPDRCAVVEDSVSGVTAALAAQMAVFAFAGGVTGASSLSLGSVVVFDDMRALPGLLAEPGRLAEPDA
jgi:HAD superfamily hydrolase (TIGR01509 family)